MLIHHKNIVTQLTFVGKVMSLLFNTLSRFVIAFLLKSMSVQSLSSVWLFVTPWTAAHQASCPSPTPGDCSNSCALSQWCHPTISSSAVPFSSSLQSFPGSGSLPRNLWFSSGGQSTRVSASASVLPMNIQDWFPLGLTNLISLQSKGLLGVFFKTIVRKHQLFGAQLSLKSFSFLGMLVTGDYQANHNKQWHGCYADLSPCLLHW